MLRFFRTLIFACAASCALLLTSSTMADSFEIDPAHSSVIFGVKHTDMNLIYGMFTDVSGNFTVDGKGTIGISIGVESINTGNAARDKHLKSPDFFSARQFPRIEFAGKEAKRVDDHTLHVTGEMTLHGVTKPITATVTTATGSLLGKERAGFMTTLEIKRSDFKVGGPMGLSDTVNVIVSLQGAKK